MDASHIPQDEPTYRVEDIQYLPHHRCPQCQAPARTIENGAWLRPYQDWFGSELSYWLDHLGYVYFQCNCQHHRKFSGALRVARLGDAILPVHFADGAAARQAGLDPAHVNAERVRQAVAFLARQADPAYTAGTDRLVHTLVAVAAGGLSPEAARRTLQSLLDSRNLQPVTFTIQPNEETR